MGAIFGRKWTVSGGNLGGLGPFLAFLFTIQGVLRAMFTFLKPSRWSWGRLLGDFGVILGSFAGRWGGLEGPFGWAFGASGAFPHKILTYSTVAKTHQKPFVKLQF